MRYILLHAEEKLFWSLFQNRSTHNSFWGTVDSSETRGREMPQIFVRRDVFRKWTKSNFQSIIYFELIWNVFKAQIHVSKVFRCAVCFNILPSFSQHPQMLQTQYWNGDIVCAENSSGNWQYMELIISCIWSLLFPSFAAISLGVGLSPVSQICLAILSH